MIEKYFAENDVSLESMRDNGVSFTFVCNHPSWEEPKTLTLSDLAVASVYGLNPKDYSRENFCKEVERLFPVSMPLAYNIEEKMFPIPMEWKESAKSHILSAKESRLFNSIDASYILSIEPPLYAYYLLREVIDAYGLEMVPTDLVSLLNNPDAIFSEKILYVRREG